jgi:alginate O-acetyltransferase complex protein AlgI
MVFTTFQFLVFFLVFLPLYWTLGKSWRLRVLLVASYYFYMCSIPGYIAVIIAITLIDFFAGMRIEEAKSRNAKSLYLILSIVCNFGLLFAFKYAGFFAYVLDTSFGLGVPVLRFILPLGISFHTFQAVSYTVEVYRGRVPAERNLLRYALYVAFFPQMVAGPIERPFNLLPQFHVEKVLSFDDFRYGLRIAMWGVFKKVVVADLLAPVVNNVYVHPREFPGPVLLLATFFFAIQIYCDFSGYSDIAIGIARMMGFRLMVNFRQPYFARSIGEFWHRWHISLSTWFRDYLYIPLGGNRVAVPRYYVNLMIVFVLSGLWHGANWTFVIWGALHGSYLVIGKLSQSLRDRARAAIGMFAQSGIVGFLRVLTTFSLVTVAWVFFRANTVGDATFVISHLLDWRALHSIDWFSIGLPRFEMGLAFVVIAIVGVTEWLIASESPRMIRLWSSRAVRLACYNACVFGIIFFGVFGGVEFIYFQF